MQLQSIILSKTGAGWMCGVKLKDRLPSKELRERLGVDDIALILQQNRLRWYGHVLRKDDDDWVKKCMEYEVEGSLVLKDRQLTFYFFPKN